MMACGNSQEAGSSRSHSIETIKIDLDEVPEVKMSSFFEELEYVPLETNDQALIGDPDKVIIYDDNIYLLEKYNTRRLSAFGLDGSLKFRINEGRGPGQLLEPSDFIVNQDTKIIEVHDNRKREMQYYDSLGNFIKSKRTGILPSSIHKANNNYYFYTANVPEGDFRHSLIITDEDFNVLENHFPIPENMEFISIGGYRNFHQYDNSLFLSFVLNDTIYEVSPAHGVQPAYLTDFGKYKVPEEVFQMKGTIDEFSDRIEEAGSVFSMIDCFQNDDWIYFHFYSNKTLSPFDAFYSKNFKKVYYNKRIENDIDNGIFGRPIHITNDHLYVLIEPYKLIQKIRNGSAVESGSNLSKLLQEVDENSNPVLMICKFKNDKSSVAANAL